MLKQHPTLRYIVLRAGWYFITFLVAISINFFLPRLGAGNPVDVIMGQIGQGLDTQTAREREDDFLIDFGLAEVDEAGNVLRDENNQPVSTSLWSQYFSYFGMVLQGDLGTSFMNYPRGVTELIREALPWTLALQIPTILFGWIIGNVLGALAAYKRGVFDKVLFPLSLLTSAVPFFAFGLILVYLFGIHWQIFPSIGAYGQGLMEGFNWPFISSIAYHYVLPFFSIFMILAGGQAIGMRSMCIYELGTDYIKYAKWLGVKESKIVYYMFRNAMLPQLTGLALSLGMMIGGALITEMIFSYPGLGLRMLDAIQNNDYPLIQGITLLVTVCVLAANFSIDILIGFLDPRVKAGQRGS
ncbi:ABC transporter permease [Chitinispirillales bacterium ANBcel5]|uniref:ABC transporter permease n=1 Tax=Cellulosispirillum alkaliphilum TaxID=3039283 RepID=UPI002A559DE8|nr:ABC transporter permease [Chitinispirillales bacterium ANBcel5]